MYVMKIMTQPNGQRGVTLLESLIALLLFSFGILGLIGMQAMAARTTADSQYRTEATKFADRLINQMRVEDTLTLSAEYSTGGTKWNAWLADVQDAASGMPGSVAHPPTITIVGTPPVVTLTMFWKGPGEAVPHQHIAVATLN